MNQTFARGASAPIASVLMLGACLAGCASDGREGSDPASTPTVTATVTASPEAGEPLEAEGNIGIAMAVTKELMLPGDPTCDDYRSSVDVTVSDGSGSLVALAELSSAEPKRVKRRSYGLTTWSCEFAYSAEFDDASSPVYTVEASIGDSELGTDTKKFSRADVENGELPFLFLSYSPGF